MAKGTNYGTEAVHFCDPQTGADIVQLTNNPTISSNLYFENINFTPDSKTVLFCSKDGSSRDAKVNLFRCDVNGRNLIQITDDGNAGSACLSIDGAKALFARGVQIISVDTETLDEEVVASFDDSKGVGNLTVGGDWIFGRATYDGESAVIRCNAQGGGEEVIRRGKSVGHVNASRTGNWVSWLDTAEVNEYDTQTWYVMRSDGSDNKRWAVQYWAHSSWVGHTDRMQGTLLPPGHGIDWCSPEDESEADVVSICKGPYFWHSGASLDGEWLVSDTNWPDIGLQLIHVPSGRYQTLCQSQASNSNHPCHPHPSISPDNSKVLFNSNRTGINQVYIASVPDWLQDELRTGKLLARYQVGQGRRY